MRATPAPAPRGHGLAWWLGVTLPAWLTLTTAALAGDAIVSIACAELPEERAAEIESRIRAGLLASERAATVELSCVGDHVEVRATAGARRAEVQVRPNETTWRDDVLGAVDAALQRLQSHQAPDEPTVEAPATAASVPPAPPPLPALVALPARPSAPQLPKRVAVSSAELSLSFQLESWGSRPATGGVLGVARRATPFGYGLRAGILRPLAQDADFDLHEFAWGLELAYQPEFAGGMRASISAGASVLLVSPSGRLTSRSGTTTVAGFLDLELGRAFWIDRLAIQPSLGLRGFSGERGVRLDQRARFTLAGLAPHVGVGLGYRLD